MDLTLAGILTQSFKWSWSKWSVRRVILKREVTIVLLYDSKVIGTIGIIE